MRKPEKKIRKKLIENNKISKKAISPLKGPRFYLQTEQKILTKIIAKIKVRINAKIKILLRSPVIIIIKRDTMQKILPNQKTSYNLGKFHVSSCKFRG